MVNNGEIILTSKGEYSDYRITGLYGVNKDFDFDEELKNFEKENPMTKPKYDWVRLDKCWDDPKFIEFLVEKDFLTNLSYKEIHQGDYYYKVTPKDIKLIDRDKFTN